jgi:integrase
MSPQAGWILQEEIVPRLWASIPRNVSQVGAEDPEELIQDATAIAAKMLHSAEAAGKKVTSGNIAFYAVQHIRSGRRSTGSSMVDVMGIGTQLAGHTRLNSLDEPAAVDEETGGDRATEFRQRCDGLEILGVSLHSYRYAWAERALKCGYPERFAQQALGHNSKAVHHAYSKHAEVTVPSLDDWEKEWGENSQRSMQPKLLPVDSSLLCRRFTMG